MDPISHALVGASIGALAPGASPGLMAATVVGAIAPDIDFVIRYSKRGDNAYLEHHRGPSHSPAALLLLGGIITAATVWLYRGLAPGTVFLWSLIGLLSHVLLDLTNAYGTKALWPWRRKAYAWDWTSVVDLWVAGIPAAGWVAVWLGLERGPVFAAVLPMICLYILLRAAVHEVLLRSVRARYPRADRISVVPEFVGINRWRYIVEQGDQYAIGWVTWQPGRVVETRRLRRREDAVIGASRLADAVQTMLRFARHPHATWQQEPDGRYVVRWTDLRYDLGRFSPFTAYAYLDPNLNLLSDRLGGDTPPSLKEGWAVLTGRAPEPGTPTE